MPSSSRVERSASAPAFAARKKRELPLQAIFVGLCWIGFAVVCLSLLASGDPRMQMIIGLCFGFATAATCLYFCCLLWTSHQTRSKLQQVHAKEKRATFDPLSVCALCGLCLGEVCPIHRRERAAGKAVRACPVSKGKCNHVYHFHCIATYLDQCVASGRNTMCPEVSDPFLWEFGSREDKGRYQQWMAERPIGRRKQRLAKAGNAKPQAALATVRSHSSRSLLSEADPSTTWPAHKPRSRRDLELGIKRQGSSRRNLLRQGGDSARSLLSSRRPNRAVPLPASDKYRSPRKSNSSEDELVTKHSSRSLRHNSSHRLTVEPLSPGSRKVVGKHSPMRQAPLELARMHQESERARLLLEREAEAKRVEAQRAKEEARRTQEAWKQQSHTVEQLKEAVESLRDEKACPVCMEDPKDMAFQCGHQVCHTCEPALECCPICRAPIHLRIKLYH